MPAILSVGDLTKVLDEVERVCLATTAGQKNPVPKLSSLDHRAMAEFILMGPASGFIALDERVTTILIWLRKTDGRYRLELDNVYNKHSRMIAEANASLEHVSNYMYYT